MSAAKGVTNALIGALPCWSSRPPLTSARLAWGLCDRDRFRKTASTVIDDTPEVEMEVQRLLRLDSEAVSSTIEARTVVYLVPVARLPFAFVKVCRWTYLHPPAAAFFRLDPFSSRGLLSLTPSPTVAAGQGRG